jgi:predicted permease
LNDLRYAIRSLAAHPGMAAAAVLTIALGVGANTAIFSGVNGLFLNPAPGVPRSGDLVEVYATDRSRRQMEMSSSEYRDYRDRSDVFTGLLAYESFPTVLSDGDSPERIWSLLVSANYFEVLEVQAGHGRMLVAQDDAGGGRPVVVISHGLWQRRFAGRAGVVGTTVAINRQMFTIIGIAPPEFRGTFPGLAFDAWIPLAQEDSLIEPGRSADRTSRAATVVGRLRDGIGAAEAEARLQVIAQDLAREHPAVNSGLSAAVYPLSRSPRGATELIGPLISVLMGVMGLLLLMTCANVANLLLARTAERQREIAVRLALGASRARLLRQLMAESLLLSTLGGAAGIGVAYWAGMWLMTFVPEIDAPIDFTIRIDRVVLAFAVAITAAAAVVFGLLPARQAARADVVPALKDGARGAIGAPGEWRLRGSLAIAQMAVSLVLLVAAGLFVRTLVQAQQVNPGFNPRNVLVGTIFLPSPGYDSARAAQFYRRLVDQVRLLPDVRSASVARRAPLGMDGSAIEDLTVDGYTPEADERPWSFLLTVSPDYFQTLGVPVVGGRDFAFEDDDRRPPAAVINHSLAARYWPGRDPVGQRVHAKGRWLTVIGVVADFTMRRVNEPPAPMLFVTAAQFPLGYMTLVVRTAGPPEDAAPAVRRTIQGLDPQLPFYAVRTLERQVEGAAFPQRAAAAILSLFSSLALLLAAVGTYGVVACNVSQRTREVGIRMALGAEASHILRLIMGGGLGLAAAGAALGLAGALVVARLLEPYLIGVGTTDAASLAGAVVLLAAAALVACYLPARRAMRVDPNVALRHE